MMDQHYTKMGVSDEYFFVDLMAFGEGIAVEKNINPHDAALPPGIDIKGDRMVFNERGKVGPLGAGPDARRTEIRFQIPPQPPHQPSGRIGIDRSQSKARTRHEIQLQAQQAILDPG